MNADPYPAENFKTMRCCISIAGLLHQKNAARLKQ